jgi:hypothetical protein
MTDTLDPITLEDPRDELAAYTLAAYGDETDPENIEAVIAREAFALADAKALRTMEVGSRDANRAAILDQLARGGDATSYTGPEPSPFVATVSERRTGRNRKGTTTKVTRRGKVWVVGDSTALDDQTTRNGRIPRVVISHAIDQLRTGNRYGHADDLPTGNRLGHADGDALARLTTTLYDVPELIGTDHYSWSEATPEIPTADARLLAVHRCGISGGLSPLLDSAIAPEYRTDDNDSRWFPSGYSTPVHVAQHVARTRVTQPRRRATDPIPADHEIVSGADDPAYMFVGHRKVLRGSTVREQRKSSSKSSKVRETFEVPNDSNVRENVAYLAATVQHDGPGTYAWRTVDGLLSGRITVDKRKRMSLTGAFVVRQCATTTALVRRLAMLP